MKQDTEEKKKKDEADKEVGWMEGEGGKENVDVENDLVEEESRTEESALKR